MSQCLVCLVYPCLLTQRAALCSTWLWGTAPTLPSWLTARMWCQTSTRSWRRWRVSVTWVPFANGKIQKPHCHSNTKESAMLTLTVTVPCRKFAVASGRATLERPSRMSSTLASEGLTSWVLFMERLDIFWFPIHLLSYLYLILLLCRGPWWWLRPWSRTQRVALVCGSCQTSMEHTLPRRWHSWTLIQPSSSSHPRSFCTSIWKALTRDQPGANSHLQN